MPKQISNTKKTIGLIVLVTGVIGGIFYFGSYQKNKDQIWEDIANRGRSKVYGVY